MDFVSLRVDFIGLEVVICILFGEWWVIYVDYVVLGWVLCSVEDQVCWFVLLFYVNIYIEDSVIGVYFIYLIYEVYEYVKV